MPLQPKPIDCFFQATSQIGGKRSNPVGRVLEAHNVLAKHYDAGTQSGRLSLLQRSGFQGLTRSARSIVDGSPVTPDWLNPQLLSSLDDQLVSICDSVPRIYNGSSWSYYPEARIVARQLAQEILHTSNHTIQAPSRSTIAGITCHVWTETRTKDAQTTTGQYFAVRSPDGAWLRTPTLLNEAENSSNLIKTVTDGTRFWVFYNVVGPVIRIRAYDTNGVQLSTLDIVRNSPGTPGYWDVAYLKNGHVVVIQPTDPVGPTDGVDLSTIALSGSTITETRVTDSAVHCTGPVSWITNDFDLLGYFVTLETGGESPSIWAYQTAGAAHTHEYNTGVFVPGAAKYVDSFVGWVEDGIADAEPTVGVGWGYLADGTATAGPLFDPALRRTQTFTTDWADTTVQLKQIDSMIPVSRAVKMDNLEYAAVMYYQSGSGSAITPEQISVTHTAGDYMTGAAVQPITISPGDVVNGAQLGPFTGGQVVVSSSLSSQTIATPDKVEVYAVTAGDSFNVTGMPVGTQLLKWTFANLTPVADQYAMSQLIVTGADIPSANASWDVCGFGQPGGGTHSVYTFFGNGDGATAVPGTFTTGNFQLLGMASYQVADLNSVVTPETMPIYTSLVASGYSTSGNNGTKFIYPTRVYLDPTASVNSQFWRPPGLKTAIVLAVPGTEVTEYSTGSILVNPTLPNEWTFRLGAFDSSSVGCNLAVTGPEPPNPDIPDVDLGSFSITAASGTAITTAGTDAAAVVAHIWASAPFPTFAVSLPLSIIPYTFKLQDLGTLDYSFIGAFISVQSSDHPENDGVYQVLPGGVDIANGLLYAFPTGSTTNQVNQNFNGDETITVIKPTSIVAPWQPTWFLVPLTGSQPMVGKWETGVAYADWRIEADQTLGPNQFPLALADLTVDAAGIHVDLPYRAQSVTASLPVATVRGQINLAGASLLATTVGLKTFTIRNVQGQACLSSGELLLPGPMAGELTMSGFAEDGINLGFEQPFFVSAAAPAAGTLGLTPNTKYQYVVVGEFTDENGNRIYTPPSPALDVYVGPTNTVPTIGGRSMNPIASDGTLIPGDTGTSCRLVGISIYRTSVTGTGANAQTTTQHFKITNDLNVNGLAPVSSLNASGFSFPDEFTWQYVDQNPDVSILSAETCYTDKGYLPRYPAPAFTKAATWKQRTFVLAYDGSIWMSGEKAEGDAVWFNPALRFVLPTDDVPNAIAALEDNLLIFCEGGEIWQIPAAVFPDATGANGTLPTPILLPFSVGCTGYAVSMRGAVAFSSTDRGQSVWAITRDLKNVPLSEPVIDSISDTTITGMVVDADQRLHVATSNGWFVYDQIVNLWTEYDIPGPAAALVALTGGQAAFQTIDAVAVYDPTLAADNIASLTGIPMDVTLAPLNFGVVRGLKTVWQFQLMGTYLGPHNVTMVTSYPDSWNEPPTTTPPFAALADKPYVIPFYPMVQDAGSFGVRIFTDFDGVVTPGRSAEWELIVAETGFDARTGSAKLPDDAGPT